MTPTISKPFAESTTVKRRHTDNEPADALADCIAFVLRKRRERLAREVADKMSTDMPAPADSSTAQVKEDQYEQA